MKVIFLSVVFIIIDINIYSVDTISTKYFPLKLGNMWTYSWSSYGPPPNNGRYRVKITGFSVTNGHLYFAVNYLGDMPSLPNQNYFENVRVDSTYGRYLKYSSSSGCQWLLNEVIYDSLSARPGDVSKGEFWGSFCSGPMYCQDTNLVNIFGMSKPSKKFTYSGGYYSYYKCYVKDIGLTAKYSGAATYYSTNLIGCIIDGFLYGDTSIIGIKPVSNFIPIEFELHQNYPNPFNPTTKIRFDIPAPSPLERVGVRLVIYDLLGREVAVLVNEQLSPGTYEVVWDPEVSGRGGSVFASGVYFYSLITNIFIQTKRMMLVK